MKRFAIAAALIMTGCEGSVGVAVQSVASSPKPAPPPSNYSIACVAESGSSKLFRIANRKTGKVHLVFHRRFVGGESMVKLEEWTEGAPR